jgi:hypothetical protein
MRTPAFERRFVASRTDDADALVALASDASYYVRRQAVQNPNTPAWILDLLVRAGATPDLRGKGEADPDLDSESLRRLAEAGPWARQLVAEHPNTSADVLNALVRLPSRPLRLAIASHRGADAGTLAVSACDIEPAIRAAAVSNPGLPSAVLELLVAAAATPDLQDVTRQYGDLAADRLAHLAGLGAWGRFLAARHPNCPPPVLEVVSRDPDWRVRSGLLDNPSTPASLIEHLLDDPTPVYEGDVRALSQAPTAAEPLDPLAQHPCPEVRLALARHPSAAPEVLVQLASDAVREVRRQAASHSGMPPAEVALMVRAGSTPDLTGLAEPDPTMAPAEIRALLTGGVWARQLAVRHPNADGETLARLLCDREPKIREWAAVHPNLPPDIKRDLVRAGCGTDFQGVMPADPDLPAGRLWEIAALGSWGEWVVGSNPYAPPELLDELAHSDDWRVRHFVGQNPGTSSRTLIRLAKDTAGPVRQAARSQRGTDSR